MNRQDPIQQERSELLTIDECSRLIRLRPSTLREWLTRKRLSYVKLGRRVFIRRSDIDALISASVVPAAQATVETENK
jgi:excisionase family DNA binding protein